MRPRTGVKPGEARGKNKLFQGADLRGRRYLSAGFCASLCAFPKGVWPEGNVEWGDAMLRKQLSDALKTAMLAKDSRRVSTVRLILAALKDRDIAARPKGLADGIGEDEIRQMLQSMIKQRRESITLYEQGNRPELAKQEADEIVIIETFLPRQMDEAEIVAAVKAAIAETGAGGLKDMGRVMAVLKERHVGQMDFTRASAVTKAELGA